MQTFEAAVVLAVLPQADQRGKQNLLQLKLKQDTFLVGTADPVAQALTVVWCTHKCIAQSRSHLAFADLTILY